jgi:hypothetical protein
LKKRKEERLHGVGKTGGWSILPEQQLSRPEAL